MSDDAGDDDELYDYWAVHQFGAPEGQVMVIKGLEGGAGQRDPHIADGFIHGILVATDRGVSIAVSTVSYMHEMTKPEVEAFLAVLEAERNNVAAQA